LLVNVLTLMVQCYGDVIVKNQYEKEVKAKRQKCVKYRPKMKKILQCSFFFQVSMY